MDATAFAALGQQVLWCSFGLSAVFGFIAERTHFCTMGAVSDVVNMGDWSRMRQWALAIAVGMLGFGAMAAVGWIDPTKSIYFSNRWQWLSAALGGVLFGVGMVLASGCGGKTLVRVGTGNLKSVVVFLVMGIAGFATLKGVTAVVRAATADQVFVDVVAGASVPAWVAATFGLGAGAAALACALVLGGALAIWAVLPRDFRTANNLLAGLGVGLVLCGMWWASGHLGFVPEHPETLEAVYVATSTGRMEAMSFVAPVSYTLDWLMFFSDKNKVLTFGIVSVLGVIAGSCLSALLGRTFRWEGFGSVEDLGNHLVGGVLMGVGGVLAGGCTVGQGLSGVSTLAFTSITALAGILAGGVLGLRYQIWRLERMG